MKNALIAMDKSKSFRIFLALTTDLVEEARKIHNTSPVATAALGRVLTAAGLMAMDLKNDDNKLTLQFKGDGPAREVLVTAENSGRVKGYISNPLIILPLKPNGKLDVGGAIGRGTVTVIKDVNMREPYIGKTDIINGEIGDDLAHYFLSSEQSKTGVALGVKVDVDYSVLAAGGFIVQLLPDAEDGAVLALEKVLDEMKPVSDTVAESSTSEEFLIKVFGSLPEEYTPEILEHRELVWDCDCCRERLEQVVMSLGIDELETIIREDGNAELVCQFCEKIYNFDKDELESLLKEVNRKQEG